MTIDSKFYSKLQLGISKYQEKTPADPLKPRRIHSALLVDIYVKFSIGKSYFDVNSFFYYNERPPCVKTTSTGQVCVCVSVCVCVC